MDPTLGQLTKQHPDYVRWMPKYADYRLIYRGGDDFLRSAGMLVNTRQTTTLQAQMSTAVTPQSFAGQRNRRFLWQLEAEPDSVYYALWNRAYYLNYCSAIIDYHRHWLFSEDPTIRVDGDNDPPDWWSEFVDNANGSGKSLNDFVRDVFLDVMICRRAGWLIGRNTNIGAQDDDTDEVVLTPYPAEQIIDWERDSTGELLWVVLKTVETYRDFPNDRMQVETYTFANRQEWATYQIKRGDQFQKNGGKPNAKPDGAAVNNGYYDDDELDLIGQGDHGLNAVPFVMLEIPEGLWIADKLAMPCLDIFNKQVRLTNAQLMSCVVQAYLKTNDLNKTTLTVGEGYVVNIKAGDTVGGGEEDFGWKSPDTAPLEFIGKMIDQQRDEIYRIVHQMALAVDSKAIGAIARSGASKIEDRKASETILEAFGGYVSEAILRTIKLLGEIYGDDVNPSIDGYRDFNVSSLDEEIQIVALAQTLQFKSQTAKEELELRGIAALFDHLSEEQLEKIEKETRDAYDQEAEAQMAPPTIPQVVGEDGNPTPAVGAPIGDGNAAKAFAKIKPAKTLGDKAENTKAGYGQ